MNRWSEVVDEQSKNRTEHCGHTLTLATNGTHKKLSETSFKSRTALDGFVDDNGQ